MHPAPVTAYLDLEPAWTDAYWTPFVDFDLTTRQRLRRYVSSSGFLASVRFLASHPARNPRAFATSMRNGECVLHPDDASDGPPLWEVDGAIDWAVASSEGPTPDEDRAHGVGVAGLSRIDPARIAQIVRVAARMHELGWRVVGFTPPIAPRSFPSCTAASGHTRARVGSTQRCAH